MKIAFKREIRGYPAITGVGLAKYNPDMIFRVTH